MNKRQSAAEQSNNKCPVSKIISQLKTLFFYEDLSTMRSQLRLVVTAYDKD